MSRGVGRRGRPERPGRRDQAGLAALAAREQAGANAVPPYGAPKRAPGSENAYEQGGKRSTKKSRTPRSRASTCGCSRRRSERGSRGRRPGSGARAAAAGSSSAAPRQYSQRVVRVHLPAKRTGSPGPPHRSQISALTAWTPAAAPRARSGRLELMSSNSRPRVSRAPPWTRPLSSLGACRVLRGPLEVDPAWGNCRHGSEGSLDSLTSDAVLCPRNRGYDPSDEITGFPARVPAVVLERGRSSRRACSLLGGCDTPTARVDAPSAPGGGRAATPCRSLRRGAPAEDPFSGRRRWVAPADT